MIIYIYLASNNSCNELHIMLIGTRNLENKTIYERPYTMGDVLVIIHQIQQDPMFFLVEVCTNLN